MAHRFSEIMFTPSVKALQAQFGSRGSYQRLAEPDAPARDRLSEKEAGFIMARDSFYMASVSETGWPYVQHRGGPTGFLKTLDEQTIGFADFRGNRQYVSTGNLLRDDRVSLILMDYPNRRRLKILGHARIIDMDAEPTLIAALELPDYRARVERGFLIRIAGIDWNCPQHITPRFTENDIEALLEPHRHRITELERENAELRVRLANEAQP
ncbi:MAG TPA: pyridoxamine 5'-phosphate oxidase family protein [Pedomonas sp.]|uniref:pyridoxamine 5'-phosphate oxidase family protein n=1 Tax=Pedomonas sp. TaxID=2976421 RepID=UPI002F416C86